MNSHSKTEHDFCWNLIPWLVNGTADEADSKRVLVHAEVCAACREELAFQRHVASAVMHLPSPGGDVEGGLARLMAHVDNEDGTPRARGFFAGGRGGGLLPATPNPGLPLRWQQVLAAAVALQTVLIAVLVGMGGSRMIWPSPQQAAYRTLSSEPAVPEVAMIHVVLAPTLSLGDMQALLNKTGLRIVAINGEGTILGLSMAQGEWPRPDAVAAKVDSLRRLPGVLLAEPTVRDERAAP